MHMIALKSSLQTVTKRDTKRDQSIWSALHARPAAEFFEQAWKKGKELPANRGGFAYLYGFICHFVLDHSCHGYIEEKMQKSGVTHAEIEVEFDRMLLEKHGHNPITSHLTNHIPADATCAGVIANFSGSNKAGGAARLYQDAIPLAVQLICEYRDKGPCDKVYQYTFGVD